MNNNWKEKKIGEIVDVFGGGTPSTKNKKYWNGNIPWLTPAELTGKSERFQYSTLRMITDEGLSNSSAKIMPINSILLTSRATIGEIVINKVPMATNQGFINIIPKKIDINYFYYWLRSRKEYLKKLGDGSTFPEISKSVFKQIKIHYPDDLIVQQQIVKIISAFDEKIELNNKANRLLEKMAQAIFKEWFIDFRFPGYERAEFIDSELGQIPKGWEVKELGSIADVQWGDTSTTKASYVPQGYPAFSATGQDGYLDHYDYDRTGIVLSAIGANCGITWLVRDKWSCIKNTIRFWSIDNEISTEYLYFATSNQKYWPQRGSAQPFITLGDARKLFVIKPESLILNQFNKIAVHNYSLIINNIKENRGLSLLRDSLLPKLMSDKMVV